ncbi:hypothetical protein ACTPOE_09580 [Castellaniella sp. WN]
MKNLVEQGAWRRAYVHTRKTGNAGQADFSCLPEGLGLSAAARCVVHPRKTLSLAAVHALRSTALRPNAISLMRGSRPQ